MENFIEWANNLHPASGMLLVLTVFATECLAIAAAAYLVLASGNRT